MVVDMKWYSVRIDKSWGRDFKKYWIDQAGQAHEHILITGMGIQWSEGDEVCFSLSVPPKKGEK